jgi:hypothetical protein
MISESISHPSMRKNFLPRLLLIVPLLLGACRDSKVATYRIPKEAETVAAPNAGLPADHPPMGSTGAGGMSGMAVPTAAGGELVWTAPADWQAKAPSAMRKGSYTVGGEGGADFAISAFPGDVGGDLANINRWRGQLELPPITEAELGSAVTPVEANGLKMLVVDLAGGPTASPVRLLGAIVPYAGSTWFFKMTGPAVVVAGEKTAYLDLLKTVKPAIPAAGAAPAPPAMGSPAPADMAGASVPQADGADLKWTAPAGWQQKPASAMRKATYVLPDAGGAGIELAVSAFPGDVGGELANVNRWRGQLQLPPLAEADLAGAVSRLAVSGLTVTVVELAGGTADSPQQLLGAIVPANGSTWFFKVTGPAAVVAREKAAFLAFLQTLRSS